MTELLPIVRFAPSPTGYLHIGNARTALFNYIVAMQGGGRFILRLDDTDAARSTAAFADAIQTDLEWLGIQPARIERQSARLDIYDEAVARLKAAGRLYPAYETPEELERKRSRQRARGRPPVYDRAALRLADAEKSALEAEGRQAHWRFLLDNHNGDPFAPRPTTVTWNDGCRGTQSVDLATVSDPVLIRGDGTYLYTLPSVVDDIDMGLTDIIRGEDHVTNTGIQIDLFRALGAEPPDFAHHNLLTLASGETLSKRRGDLSLQTLREAGFEPMTIASLAVLIGTAHTVAPYDSLNALADMFDMSATSRAPARFEPEDFARLNARLLHDLGYDAVADRLSALGAPQGRAFWEAVHRNIDIFSDVDMWRRVVEGPIEPVQSKTGASVLAAAIETVPEGTFDTETWSVWTGRIKEKTDARGRALFMPLRLALTGLDHGPELAALLPLIGRRKTVCRLRGQAA